MSIVFLPCAGVASQNRFNDTVKAGIAIDAIEPFVDQDITAAIRRGTTGKTVGVWGFMLGKKNFNVGLWKKINPGDTVVFYWEKELRYKGTVVTKTENVKLAEKLWGTGDNSEPWQLVYFIKDVAAVGVHFAPEMIGCSPRYTFEASRYYPSGTEKCNIIKQLIHQS